VVRSCLRRLFLVGLAIAASGCDPKVVQPGTGCHLNSDCDNPLVCEFGMCRAPCTLQIDCPSGELCVPFDDAGGGVCELPADGGAGTDAGDAGGAGRGDSVLRNSVGRLTH
jgi:hypothetical protein